MKPRAAESLANLLEVVDEAERASLTHLFPMIYDELRRVARRYM
jgi:hypothetical protein